MTRINRKALIPLATALAAGAVAIGSGATFTSQSNSATSFTTGTLKQTNDHAAIFNATNMKPGDSATGTVTISNTGSLAQSFTLDESGVTNNLGKNTLGAENLSLKVVADGDTAHPLYNGDFSSLGSVPLGTFAATTGSHTYTFTVTLDPSTGNAFQSKDASATFTWNGTQAS